MRIELTIDVNYLPEWKVWHGIREIVQNARDAEIQYGAKMSISWAKDTLFIQNRGVTLKHEALLLGNTSKAGRVDLAGQWGEGLKLGVLALLRCHMPVRIRSGTETWTPSLEYSERFNAKVLVFNIAKRGGYDGVSVEIGNICLSDWLDYESRFLFLFKQSDIVSTNVGTLLLDEKHRGNLYCKGIWVNHDSRYSFGYDLKGVQLDRDRKLIDPFDLGWQTRNVWSHAACAEPEKLVDHLYDLLAAGKEDIINFRYDGNLGAVSKRIAERFKLTHGEKAFPVAGLAESKELEHLGRVGIIVSAPLLKVLETVMGSYESLAFGLKSSIVQRFAWQDLTSSEREILTRAIALISPIEPVKLEDVDVAEFQDSTLIGLYTGGRFILNRVVLRREAIALSVLIHEVAHRTGADGEKSHVETIERIWTEVWERRGR